MQAKSTSTATAVVMMLIGLCAGLFTGLAHAAPDDLDRVTVTARRGAEPVHTNVRATCPGIEASLNESLGVTQARHQREGLAIVTFRLSGSDITEIQQRGGPFEYRSDIRRAVRRLACHTEGQEKLYVMELLFRNEVDGQPAGNRAVALLD